jgi:hypothetical protein
MNRPEDLRANPDFDIVAENWGSRGATNGTGASNDNLRADEAAFADMDSGVNHDCDPAVAALRAAADLGIEGNAAVEYEEKKRLAYPRHERYAEVP